MNPNKDQNAQNAQTDSTQTVPAPSPSKQQLHTEPKPQIQIEVIGRSPKLITTWLEVIGFGVLLALLTYIFLGFLIQLLLSAFYSIPILGFILAILIGKVYIFLSCLIASAAVYYAMKARKLDTSFLVAVGASVSAYYATSMLLTLVPYGERQPFVERPLTIPAFLVSGAVIFLLYYALYVYASPKSMSLVLIIIAVITGGFFVAGKDIAAKDKTAYRENMNTTDFTTYISGHPPSGWSNLKGCTADNSKQMQNEKCQLSFGKNAENTYGSTAQVKQFVYSNDLNPYLPTTGKCNLFAVHDMGSARPGYRQEYIKKTRQGYKKNNSADLYAGSKNSQCREIGTSKYGTVYAEVYQLSKESKQRARENGQTGLLVEDQLYTGDIYAKVNQTVVMLSMGQDYETRAQVGNIIEFYNSLVPGKGERAY